MSFYYMNEFITERNLDTYGAETNVANMWRCAVSLYETLKDKFNLEESFLKEPDKTIYRRFLRRLRLEDLRKELYPVNSEALEEIRKYRIAYVYGVGPLGRTACKALENRDVLIGGFLTNKPENAPSVFMGRSVLELAKTEMPEDSIVVVATSRTEWEEIRALLEKRNVRCMSYRNLSATFLP